MSTKHIIIERSAPLKGALEVPGDKSITHRALIFSALAAGESEIFNPSTASDCRSTASALRRLGADIRRTRGRIMVSGIGGRGFTEPAAPLDFGNSGTGLRLMTGAIASSSIYAVLDGDASLRRRPMDRIITPLRQMGGTLWGRGEDRFPPLAVKGRRLEGIAYTSPVASAQVKSAVVIAALAAEGRTVFTEPRLSRDHTERMLPVFGAGIEREDNGISLTGPQSLRAASIRVPGDISSAAFFLVGALIVPGSRLTIRRVGLNPGRTGSLEILRRMGGKISWRIEEDWGGEPVGTVEAEYSALEGTVITGEMIPSAIDELPIISVAAAAAKGRTVISGASELRVKESDRISAMASQLSAMGAGIQETEDGLVVEGGRPLQGAALESWGDHRIAMSLAVAACTARGRTLINNTGNIETSYPGFEDTLKSLTG